AKRRGQYVSRRRPMLRRSRYRSTERRCVGSRPPPGSRRMLTIAEAQRRTEQFLTAQMLEALRAVEYDLPSFDTEPVEVELADVARSRVEIRHVRGASDATYLVSAFGDELLMQLQVARSGWLTKKVGDLQMSSDKLGY